MSDEVILNWFPYAFPFFFVGMWLLATTMLGFMSGWFSLQQWYPDDGNEEPLLKLRGQSGSMGIGVQLNSCLTLRAYPSGLGVGIWRIFGLFQKPLRIPWSEIEAEPSRIFFFVPTVKLHFGRPSNGTLKISARSWFRLVEAVPQSGSGKQIQMPAAAPVSSQSVAQGIFLQWVTGTMVAAAFFYFASRTDPRGAVPLAICIGLPAVVLGLGQLIRYARQG
ncbi:MAG: hypothetical protein QOD54_1137 [Sphingomonadales bacterium]|nr:hypothetical protein [Sphingomonadales bacterium]